LGNRLIMGAAAIRVTEKKDEKESIDQQDIFYGVVSFLTAITRFLFNRVLGADEPPFRPVMGKRGNLTRRRVRRPQAMLSPPAERSRWRRPPPRRRGAGTGPSGSEPGHRRGCAAQPAARARARESTDWLCSGPCRRGVPGPPARSTSSHTRE